jgi:kinesin family protein 5
MNGPSIDDEKNKGIVPRMVDMVFEKIENSSEDIEFVVKVSMVEIYLERIKVSPTLTHRISSIQPRPI